MATAKMLDDIAQCPICTETYTDPRVLPCVHTYCLKCIEAWSKDKQPGDELACPLCRKEFTLPGNGVSDLPKNFFIANFLQARALSSVESKTSPCEVCSDGEESDSEVQNVASVYCVECQLKLCHVCERGHKVIKATRSHKLINIGEKISIETLQQTVSLSYCDQHKDELLKIYCFDCKLAICVLCYIKSHNGHKCSDVNEVRDEFHRQMTSDIHGVSSGVDRCREMLESLEKVKKEFIKQVEKAGVEISEKAEQVKRMIDDHKEKLMNELSSMKQKRMKEIESLREEIERQLMSMESYKKYVDEVRQKGTACDIARTASGLHDRADELLIFDVIECTLAELSHADITFTSSNYVIDDVNKTVGHLKLSKGRSVNLSALSLKHVIPSDAKVYAVTSLGDEVFVARYNTQKVEVYDAVTLSLQRSITVPGLGPQPYGLIACIVNSCLYMSDDRRRVGSVFATVSDDSHIHRADLTGSNAVMKWSVARHPRGLSVNRAHNVVVACWGANKLQEYTTHGSLVREICVTKPYHAVQLSSGDYVVRQSTSPCVVIVVGVDGQVRHSYRQSQTSDVRLMKNAASLAVTKNDDIFVADELNNRIMSMNSSLSSVQELTLPVDGGIQQPMGLCLDESRGRLYVGECRGKYRVLVFGDV